MSQSERTTGAVLVAITDPDLQLQVRAAILDESLEPVVCEVADQVVSVFSREAPDLVILDLDLPGCPPIDITREIRANIAHDDTPILLLANPDDSGARIAHAIEEGANDYLLKPIKSTDLLAKMRGLLEGKTLPHYAQAEDLRDEVNWKLKNGQPVVFSGYRFTEIVGRGGMGTIYGARDEHGNPVAIKILSPVYASNRKLLARFLREARQVMTIQHPNIIEIREIDCIGSSYYTVMEYLSGGSLKELLEMEGKLEVGMALGITECIGAALAILHKHRIVHRDIKPGNILISEEGQVKLVDFGLAKSSRDRKLTKAGVVLGTPRYIAPEQARRGMSADIRSDIYSLGITLYHMLTGNTPFLGDDTTELLMAHLAERARPIGDHGVPIPPMVNRLVSLMIAKEPEDRFQTPNQLLEGIQLTREGEDPMQVIPSEMGPTTSQERIQARTAERRRKSTRKKPGELETDPDRD